VADELVAEFSDPANSELTPDQVFSPSYKKFQYYMPFTN